MEGDALYIAYGLVAASAAKFLLSAWIRNRRLERFVRIGTVSDLIYYPVKSCQGISLKSGTLHPLGLYTDGIADRSWMFTRPNGAFLCQSQFPKMTLIKVSNHGNMIQLDAPGMPTLQLPKFPKIDSRRFFECRVWDLTVQGMDCGEEASRWASDYLGKENLHIVFSAPDMEKKVITDEGVPPLWTDMVQQGDKSIFSDYASYLVTTDQSLEAVNKLLDKPVSMRNFRPNIVINTTKEAFDEDLWCELKFGENGYMRCLHPCPRCSVTTVDLDTGKRDPSYEPIKTMKKFRCKPDRGKDPFFGVNASVDFPADIRVGDPVYTRYRTN